METRKLRNIGIIAHVDAGKTTTTERLLYYTGKIHRMGEVHFGAATMDSDEQEKKRGITINSAATTVYWKGCQINVIDTPGHIDFNIEVNRSLRVLDGAVVVFDAVAGVEPQTETNWRLADKYRVPRIAFVNKLDRTGANFSRVVSMMEERLGVVPLVLQLPLAEEEGFTGVVDLMTEEAIVWPSDKEGSPYEHAPIPAALADTVRAYRTRLVERAVEQDDAVLARYIDGETIDAETLRACIRAGTASGALVPVLCGSAKKNRGVEPLLDAIAAYLPAPADVQAEDALERTVEGPFAALAFKVVNDDHGTLTYVRVYRGRLEQGATVVNATNGKRERISRLYEVHADQKHERKVIEAGDIVAVGGLKFTATGDTLADLDHPLVLERIVVPEPVIDVAVEARTSADQTALHKALHAVLAEDPSLRLRVDDESGQTILSGMGELQLEVTLEKLRSRHHVDVQLGRPQVAYRETITRTAEIRYLHKKQGGGPGQYAEVVVRFEPLQQGEGFAFENSIAGGAIPREFIPSVENGIRRAAELGMIAGFPCVDFKATLVDGSYHSNDSSTMAFEAAGAAVFREAVKQAGPVVLEPIMAVEVITPPEHVGTVIGDLTRRRGLVRHQDSRSGAAIIDSHVPLKEMFGYIGDLRAQTSGRASFSMAFDHYTEVPQSVASQLVK